MSAVLSLLMSIVVSLAVSAILVRAISTPLRRVLDALCSSGESSQFWVTFISIMLFIGPLLLSVIALSPLDGQALVRVLRTTLVATLIGAFIPLLVVGMRISFATPRNTGTH